MISVVAGHLGVSEINNVVYSYHLTVFFILSGFTLKPVDINKEYLNKKFRALMLPYFITCFCILLMDILNQIWWWGGTSIRTITELIAKDLARSFFASGSITSFGRIEIGTRIGAIWFLPALFFALIFTQLLLKWIRKPAMRFIVGCTLMLLAMITAKFVWLPFSIQSGMFAVPFLLAGYEIKRSDFLERLNWRRCIVSLILFLLCLYLNMTKINFVTASADDIFVSLLAGASSSLIVIFLSMKLEKCKPLAWIGRHSLICLCVHLFELETMGRWFQCILEHLSIPYTEFSCFCIKMIFIIAVTAGIVFLKQRIHFRPVCRVQCETKSRDKGVDIVKGILIGLMLVGHFPVEENFRSILYSFHMMAFVFFSGYFFTEGKNIPSQILKLAKKLLLPYAIYSLFAVFVLGNRGPETVLLGISFTKKVLSEIPSVGPVYFILMLFLVRIVYLLIARLCPNEYWKHGICVFVSLLGVYLGNNGYWLPWSLDCALYSVIFYHLGYCFRKYKILEYFKNHLVSYFLLSAVWAYMIHSGSMELAIRQYGSYGMTILGATSAIILLYMLSCYISETFPAWLTRLIMIIGQSTLYILIVHTLLNSSIMGFVSLEFGEGYIYHMTATIFLTMLLGILVYLAVCGLKRIAMKKVKSKP